LSPRERLGALPPEARTVAIAALDEISRPLTVNEINVAFAKAGIPRWDRRPMIRALMQAFDVIVLEPKQ
jgi:hypothetical protein